MICLARKLRAIRISNPPGMRVLVSLDRLHRKEVVVEPPVMSRAFFSALLSVLLAASFVLVLSSGQVSAAGASTVSPSTSNCQNTQPMGMPGAWTCTLDDEFNGTSLDTSKWTPKLSAATGYTTGTNSAWPCYVNNPSTISESGGYLDLSVVQVAAPFSCVTGHSTSFEAGMVSTEGLYDQTYGAFEVNAELPPSVANGLQETFWLYPQALTYGAWPNSGEIDFAEFYSQYPNLDVPYIHYSEAASGDPNVTAYNCTINQGKFNTYGVDWEPGTLTIYLNGNVCLVDHPNPAAPLSSSEPFNDPFFLALTAALGSGTDAYVPGTTQLPATTLVDWARAWASHTYSVTYNANGATAGSVPVDPNSYAAGNTVSVLANTANLADPGYSLEDWNTAPDGSGTSYAPGSTFAMPAGAVTLYAIWAPDVVPEKTTTGLSLSKSSLTYGAETSETFTVTVTGQSGDGYPEGTVTVYSASTQLCSHTLVAKTTASSTASCSLSVGEIGAGIYSDVFATYTPSTTSSSNSKYAYTASTSASAARLSVGKDTTTTKISEAPTIVTFGSESTAVFTAGVTAHNGEAVPNGERVTVSVGSATCTISLNAGTGACTIAKSALPTGSYAVSATYAGDPNLGSSKGTSAIKLTVKK
ncbi:MAG TPA: family 16 glycosylhydrolase [Acidimicrobiales bacterium]|nr:family 16 glycosylhydrolase [Acidimicrobiales bacterium]